MLSHDGPLAESAAPVRLIFRSPISASYGGDTKGRDGSRWVSLSPGQWTDSLYVYRCFSLLASGNMPVGHLLACVSKTAHSTVGGGTVAPVNSSSTLWRRLDERLRWPGWTAVGVILASVLSLVGYLLASGGSSSISQNITVHGSCNAAGNGNTVTCAQPSSRTNR